MALRVLTAALLVAVPVAFAGAQGRTTAPESFKANGQVLGAAGGAASAMTIAIDSYTSDADHDALAGRDHRRVAVAIDEPVFFAGAGAVDAKPTAGYDLAIIEFTVDSVGLGKGTMAPAARVKAGGPTGVEVEDYSGKRIELMTVRRELK